jgi:hypothetical protein
MHNDEFGEKEEYPWWERREVSMLLYPEAQLIGSMK